MLPWFLTKFIISSFLAYILKNSSLCTELVLIAHGKEGKERSLISVDCSLNLWLGPSRRNPKQSKFYQTCYFPTHVSQQQKRSTYLQHIIANIACAVLKSNYYNCRMPKRFTRTLSRSVYIHKK